MATNEMNDKRANDKDFKDWVEASIKLSENISLKNVNDFSNFITNKEYDLIDMLEMTTRDIDKPVLKSLANDMIGVLGSFYMSEEALCCLIKNLLMTAGLTDKLLEYNDWIFSLRNNSDIEQINGLYINEDNFKFVMSETNLAKGIDALIAVIDIIITFLNLDLKDIVFPSLDFIREITEATIGFLCIAIQEIIFTMRDSGIQYIINKINEVTDRENYAKCFPFMDFMSILKKYIHDYGLAKKLSDLIQGFIGDGINKFKKKFDAELPKNVKLIEMLKYIKFILNKIKEAVFSWEYCIFLNQDPDVGGETNANANNPYFKYLQDIINTSPGTNNLNNNNFLIADNDTILQNVEDGSSNSYENGQNSINVPTNDEVRSFLQNYMGLTADRTDQLLGDGDARGTGNGVGNSCGNILSAKDMSSIFELIIQQSRIG